MQVGSTFVEGRRGERMETYGLLLKTSYLFKEELTFNDYWSHILNSPPHHCHIFILWTNPTEMDLHFKCVILQSKAYITKGLSETDHATILPRVMISAAAHQGLGHCMSLICETFIRGAFPTVIFINHQINIGDFSCICLETFYPDVEHSNSTAYK